ncbi:ABC transporter ATP-binding protein [Caldinitratiruptor microaerophilus]|uniref:ABC transporter ATP-binding protein n=1 Tax=Caldinitratiruptor microaerophilus TaxID=671077 RepID=A0AA35CLC5_9FIRM|nr:ABC transporter ATP-binding protein [Caldinitratiruptor microaerophilus]BDG61439.1 ABC transporter ATP-binding protein [Caldinitratiruptor microaerophilus]
MADGAGRLLGVEDVGIRFGGVVALGGVSLDVRAGEIHAVIGPNGAGKTTLINCISGRYVPTSGRITLAGEDITRLPPPRRAELGIARTFQNIALFKHMTVLDNLMLGRHVRMRSGLLACGLFWGPALREEIEHRRAVEEIIDFLEIAHIRKKPVGMLPYGLQKRVELGRALALEPRLLLLDEPMAGMNTEEKEDMVRFILEINQERGVTCVLVEHDMGVVMDISDRVSVLDFGRLIASGSPEEVRRNPDVIRAYLGDESLAVV